jgi:hypothetical protein
LVALMPAGGSGPPFMGLMAGMIFTSVMPSMPWGVLFGQTVGQTCRKVTGVGQHRVPLWVTGSMSGMMFTSVMPSMPWRVLFGQTVRSTVG